MIKYLLILLLLIPTTTLAFDIGSLSVKNTVRLFYVDNGKSTHNVRGEHRVRLSVTDVPLWVSNYYSVDYDPDEKNSWQMRSTAGFKVNKSLDLLVERHEYSARDREVYRAGIQLQF